MKTLGICFGASTIQTVELHADRAAGICTVVRSNRIAHEGNTRQALIQYLSSIDCHEFDRVAVTGRAFRTKVVLASIAEPEAVEYALRASFGSAEMPGLVVSIGGETMLLYRIAPSGAIISVHSGNKCASGTGEFFLQQIRRMGLGVDEAVSLAGEGEPHRVAGRCSVFCKSDCTHALNKGIPAANIAAGLCRMMADKIDELIKDMTFDAMAIIGGGSLNTAVVDILRSRYPGVVVPQYATVFEAYGAALWALENPCEEFPQRIENICINDGHSISRHPPLTLSTGMVEFRESQRGVAQAGDSCVLGLDVGSTTTKAVLVRLNDKKIIAGVYFRTNGNPIEASRECYRDILLQINGMDVSIIGLGVTGSGRQIAGLHALTTDIINEIIAHATAAAFFDPQVDTIFEIGGQDAKYTYLTSGVPSDYAMNEACSAGTGSFLEEAAKESLNIDFSAIAEHALAAASPPNFTDQCAAFISSDIKRAAQEGIGRDDILAGLVYSVCMNYLNRVKGNRPVGKRIFMQGGVCYNRAVPVAMASLIRAHIVVPPEPGLMGAFGVALEVARRLETGQSSPQHFDLQELAAREAIREKSFICAGGSEKCDRKCGITLWRIGDASYPFGGACNRYYNLRFKKEIQTADLDLVAVRQKLLFDVYGPARHPHARTGEMAKPKKSVGINVSFLTYSLYPLFSNFFARLGFDIILSDRTPTMEGASRAQAAFCYPAAISHAAFYSLLDKKCDYIFLPHVAILPVPNVPTYSKSCPVVQGEPYYLQSAFRREIERSGAKILAPVLKMQGGYGQAVSAFTGMAEALGVGESDAQRAFEYAVEKQIAFEKELRRIGRKALYVLAKEQDRFGVVLFGRPYNAFADNANMGIPHKIASRGVMCIPFDMLPADHYAVDRKMFWAQGQKIMKAAQYVKDHRNLFAVFITNFSCGPDSFLLGYFRECMAQKPSLTLELDEHTADAGLDTRIEAALDIMTRYREPTGAGRRKTRPAFTAARVAFEPIPYVYSSSGQKYALNDPRVEVVFPSMGVYHSLAAAAVLRGMGIDSRVVPLPDSDTLLTGRKNTTCKECLPYQVVVGSFLTWLKRARVPGKVTVFFLATGGGPCRLGQYYRAFEQLIVRNKIPDTAVLTLTDENQYAGMGSRTLLKAWQGIVAADVFCDIGNMLAVTARDPISARQTLDSAWREVLAYLEGRLSVRFSKLLSWISLRLASIPLARAPSEIPVVSLVGEIFVRRDEFSRNNIVEFLQRHGFMVRIAPVSEFLCYGNHIVSLGIAEMQFGLRDMIKLRLTARIQEWWERRIKTILAESGLYLSLIHI